MTTQDLLNEGANLSISRFVLPTVEMHGDGDGDDLKTAWLLFESSGRKLWERIDDLVETLPRVVGGVDESDA